VNISEPKGNTRRAAELAPADGLSHQNVKKAALEQFFADVASRMRGLSCSSVSPRLKDFFASANRRVNTANKKQCDLEKRLAIGFNVFDLFEPDENKLSDVLEFLLNPDGSHGQQELFLRLLLDRVGLRSSSKRTRNAKVRREVRTHEIQKYRRRMDVLVEAGVTVAIENKKESMEQADQVQDYLEHLGKCSRRSGQCSILIYLTPDGRPPDHLSPARLEKYRKCGKLLCWSYQDDLYGWLESCRRECTAPKIRDFISAFMTYSHREPEINQDNEANEE
jgi:hypothetical protein